MFNKPKKWLLLLPILPVILGATSACAGGLTGPRHKTVSDYCLIAAPLRFDSAADSAATVAEIAQHNSTWVCLCEQDCPKAKE